jgi:hypothetical protein
MILYHTNFENLVLTGGTSGRSFLQRCSDKIFYHIPLGPVTIRAQILVLYIKKQILEDKSDAH